MRRAVAYLNKTKCAIETPVSKLYPVEFQDEFKVKLNNDNIND